MLESYSALTLFENESISDINYPELLTCVYQNSVHAIISRSWYNQSILACLLFSHTKFIKKIYLFTNFEFSQKFPVKSQIFLHTEIVPIALCTNDEK